MKLLVATVLCAVAAFGCRPAPCEKGCDMKIDYVPVREARTWKCGDYASTFTAPAGDSCQLNDAKNSVTVLTAKVCEVRGGAASKQIACIAKGDCEFTVPLLQMDHRCECDPCASRPCGAGKICVRARKMCITTPCPQYTCLSEGAVAAVSDPCALRPCLSNELCATDNIRCVRPPCYACNPVPKACCRAAAVCRAGEVGDRKVACTLDELKAGTCRRSSICCDEIFCRKEAPLREGDVCKSGGVETGNPFDRRDDCPKGTGCHARPGDVAIGGEVTHYCTSCAAVSCASRQKECEYGSTTPKGSCCPVCNPKPIICCLAEATCEAGETRDSLVPCTAEELKAGTCRVSSICCSTAYCRKVL